MDEMVVHKIGSTLIEMGKLPIVKQGEIVVSSGSCILGKNENRRVASAIGQPLLMNLWDGHIPCQIGLVLVGSKDIGEELYITLTELLAHNVVPIINANDICDTWQLYKDNDELAAKICGLMQATTLRIWTGDQRLTMDTLNMSEAINYPGLVSKIRTRNMLPEQCEMFINNTQIV